MFKKRVALMGCSVFLLTGCETLSGFHMGPDLAANQVPAIRTLSSGKADYSAELKEGRRLAMQLGQTIPKGKVTTATRALAAEATFALEEGRLEDASKLFNTALRLDLSNSTLQFMNALTYHLMAVNGDTEKFALAEQGYALAYKFDSSNPLSPYYQGLAFLDQRKFAEAKTSFAVAAVMDDRDPEILYDLARAAYYAGDPRTADAALAKVAALAPAEAHKPKLIRASIMTKAALGQMDQAQALLEEYRASGKEADSGTLLERRVTAWQRVHEDVAGGLHKTAYMSADSEPMKLAQVIPGADAGSRRAVPGSTASRPGNSAGTEADFVNADMAVVDVVMVGTQDDVSDTKGMNLLSGLQLQFGDPLTTNPGFSWGRSRSDDRTATDADTYTKTFSRLISIPAVNYSLNIFNTLTGRNEILARPSLIALANERSEFFSGVDVVAAAVSKGDGSSVSINKQIGVKLSIVPEFLPGDRIKLKVDAERTFLTTPSRSVEFQFRLDTSKTNVTANVVMKFGETLVLSGLTEKETEKSRDAVPLLGDIPIMQYLFARQGEREFRKSVLIMLTPRRAQYLNQDPVDREKADAKLSELERAASKFEERNKQFFVPKSTLSEILGSVEGNSLFQEFKTGDFQMERWNARSTHAQRLSSVKEFLFY